jgi:hypothetical protein
MQQSQVPGTLSRRCALALPWQPWRCGTAQLATLGLAALAHWLSARTPTAMLTTCSRRAQIVSDKSSASAVRMHDHADAVLAEPLAVVGCT